MAFQPRLEHTYIAGQLILALLLLYAPVQMWVTVTQSLVEGLRDKASDSGNVLEIDWRIQGMDSVETWRASGQDYVASSVSAIVENLNSIALCGESGAKALQRIPGVAGTMDELARSGLCAVSEGLERVGRRWRQNPSMGFDSLTKTMDVTRQESGKRPDDDWVVQERLEKERIKKWRLDIMKTDEKMKHESGEKVQDTSEENEDFVGENERYIPCSGIGVPVTVGSNDVCVCPITRTGIRCKMYRPVICNVTLEAPEKKCNPITTDHRENLLERDPACIIRQRTDSVNLSYKLFCYFSENPNPDRRSLMVERNIQFTYYANRSDEFAVESANDYALLYRPFNFFHLTNQSRSTSLTGFTKEQIIGAAPISLTVSLDDYEYEYFAGGRLYFEGKPTSPNVPINPINSREFIDIIKAEPVYPREMPAIDAAKIVSIVFGVLGGLAGAVFLYIKIWRTKPILKPAN